MDDLSSDASELEKTVAGWLSINLLEGHIYKYSDSSPFMQDFRPGRFAIVFLDILLGEGKENGIAIAQQLREADEDQPLVFTTTARDFALESYSVQALDYFVKPYAPEKVAAVLKRVLKRQIPPTSLEIKDGRATRRIPLDAIIYAATVNRAVEIHTKQGIFKTYMTLEKVAAQLHDKSRFRCCCRGMLVNLDYVQAMEAQDFLLYGGERLPISRSKRVEMREAYTSRLFARTREESF